MKKSYDIPKMFRLIREAIKPYPKAMLFQIYEEGHHSPFEQLMACLLSIRTRDETSLVVAKKLFKRARTPKQMSQLTLQELGEMVQPCTFPFQKAKTILSICEKILADFDGKTPCDFETLTSLPGVGPKCANLVLGISCGIPSIGVDIHVHRVTNRWGYIQASTAEKSWRQLQKKLPRSKWVEINELLVPFGKHICTGVAPKCLSCPVLDYCQQVGVTAVRRQGNLRRQRSEAQRIHL